MNIQPYLMFEGRCDEALEFYKRVLGAEVLMLMRFKESPDPSMCSPDSLDKVMHSAFKIGDSVILASDGRCQAKGASFEGFALTLNADTDADAERIFAALSEGGNVFMPLAKTFYASSFGMLSDRFGTPWMVIKVLPM